MIENYTVFFRKKKKLWHAAGITKKFVKNFLKKLYTRTQNKNTNIWPCYLTVIFSDNQTVHELNKAYRHTDKPTNVLSFTDTYDIILAYETLFQEALEQKKSFSNHVVHILLHGILHLAGYDHEKEEDAQIMEHLEIQLLLAIGIKNPYESQR